MHLKIDKKLLRQSGIIFTATVISGIFTTFFQLYIGRALGPSDYGEFSALTSLLIITSVPASTIATTIAFFISEYNAKAEFGKIKYLLIYSVKKLLIFGLIGFFLIAFASGAIASFLNITSIIPILIIGMIFIVSVIHPITTGALQGLQNFTQAGFNGFLAAASKLIFGILFVYIGWDLNGAILALLASPILAFLVALIPLRVILKEVSIKTHNREVFQYSIPIFITTLIITLILNIDIMLVKHYFSASEAGYYSAASLLSKIIFFITTSIAIVMFPKISELHTKKEKTISVLKNCLAYTGLFSLLGVFIYWIAPTFVVNMLFGSEYGGTINIIGMFAVALMFFSLSYIIIIYNMAIKNFKFIYVITAGLLFEILLLSMFHETLLTVVKILAILSLLLFVAMAIDVLDESVRSKQDQLDFL